VPLEIRCQAALVCIYDDARRGIRKRRELLAAAIWPSQARTPAGEPVAPPEPKPEPLLSPPRYVPPAALPQHERPSTIEQRDEARPSFRAGASISELADRYRQPWSVVRGWVRAKGERAGGSARRADGRSRRFARRAAQPRHGDALKRKRYRHVGMARDKVHGEAISSRTRRRLPASPTVYDTATRAASTGTSSPPAT
jgi:hypothetical protein